jgi:hypothetical protein
LSLEDKFKPGLNLRPVSLTFALGWLIKTCGPAFTLPVANVELCHWPSQSLHTLCHPSPCPVSSYTTKFTLSMSQTYIRRGWCHKAEFLLWQDFHLSVIRGSHGPLTLSILLSPRETLGGPGLLYSCLDLLARSWHKEDNIRLLRAKTLKQRW